MKTLLSLFDASGVWSAPYARAGWQVVQVDLTLDPLTVAPGVLPARCDVLTIDREWLARLGPVSGLLIADPCTDFASSGARHFKAKDRDGRTAQSVALLRHCLRIVAWCEPLDFWCRENPVGRSARLVPELKPLQARFRNPEGKRRAYLEPHWFGDAYTKRTCLFGRFNADLPQTPVAPVMFTDKNGKRGSWQWMKLGGKSARTKQLRSVTPAGFARAFHAANH